MMHVERLLKRSQFVAVNESGLSIVMPAFVLLFLPKDQEHLRMGFTASRKIGGAVQRNRARRRLRAVVDEVLRLNDNATAPVGDMVLIARHRVLTLPYPYLCNDLKKALAQLAEGAK